jgi:phosphoglucosamine mutase
MLRGVMLFPQTLLNVRLTEGLDWRRNPRLAAMQDEVTRELADQGRVLIRASGTEPVLRVMVECADGEQSARFAERIAATLRH